MKTVTLASAKGGSGKSTLTSALAVRSCQDALKPAMMDLNFDQASLGQWWTIRGKPKAPQLARNVENIPRDVRTLATAYDWLFIDTPPAEMDLIEQAVAVADVVLIPIRCGFFDVLAVQTVIEMCRSHRRTFALVLNAVDNRFDTLTTQTLVAIDGLGRVLNSRVSYRQNFIKALAIGKTGPEIDRALKPEIDALWAEVKELAEKGAAYE
jgi:chromosome partitioning protein